jgi:hydroxymethylpyrimidine/phosphomethylpyrimidine kinase
MKPLILCVGGLDPSGSAGLLADAEAVRDSGGRPLAVATALTVQTDRAVRSVHLVPTALIVSQLEALFAETPPDAVKLGMLGRAAIAPLLARFFTRRLGKRPLVVDPVLKATSGGPLFRGSPRAYAGLFSLSTAVTPNLPEAAALLNWKAGVAWDRATMARAAHELLAWGPRAVVLKGGHLTGRHADDLLAAMASRRTEKVTWLSSRRLERSARGTGCRFASALTTELARGASMDDAAAEAKRLVRRYLLTTR